MSHRMHRAILVCVMAVALLCANAMRRKAVAYQAQGAAPAGAQASRTALGNMNSFAIALLLGGLRGPLVMVLWSTSESQKIDKNLEDFDTKVEWIRLLQPEFDTVHLFQIWNKAYNISVQMAGLPNRYACILDALDYARNVDESRPDNINILQQVAMVYSNKLGTIAQEKNYYRRRVREDSLPRKVTGPRLGEKGFQRRRMDPLLDEQFRIIPQYLVVHHPRPADLPPGAEWNTGEELQYLKQYEAFPYGVSTFALAYNYAKRSEAIMNITKQKPLQLSESVFDSRPALELKSWTEEEWERGRVAELSLFGQPAPIERTDMELPTAAAKTLALTEANRRNYDAAIFAYNVAARLAADAQKEYTRHISKPEFLDKVSMYQSHLDRMQLAVHMVTADRLYLQALTTTGAAERSDLLKQASAEYQKAIDLSELIILRYYIRDEIAERTYGGVAKANVASVSPEKRHAMLIEARKAMEKEPPDDYGQDRPEFEGYIHRATLRIQNAQEGAAG